MAVLFYLGYNVSMDNEKTRLKTDENLVMLDTFLILVASLFDLKTALILALASLLFFYFYNLAKK